ncbi:MAG: SH3 domain-containing protein [Anaerolineae bacterium]|nr:SH3 domain-containing protein [Anaerolineae bacterium]
MKMPWKTITTMLLFSTTMVAGAQVSIAAQTQRAANVRSGPGMEYTLLEQLEAGREVLLTGRSTSNTAWLRMELQGREGWIIRYSLESDEDFTQLRVVNPRRPVRVPAYRPPVQARASRTVNVRSGPTTSAEVVSQLEDGERVPVIGRSDERTSWLWVDLDGEKGWVAYFTVAVDDEVVDLPLVSNSTAEETKIIPRADTGVTAYVFRTVNVRSGPSIEFERIGQLESGDTVAVTGRSDTGNNWLQIEFEDMVGWVAYFTVSVSGNPDALPVIEMDLDPTPIPA